MNQTRATDIEAWTSTRFESRNIFPALIRRLILATNNSIQRIDMPSEEEVQRRGWDAVVVAGNGSAWVPDGTSGWELGTGINPAEKARMDLATRTREPLALEQGETTFIFVTPRSWQGKREWEINEQNNGLWRSVRAYDSSDLAQWLGEAPAVDAWLAVERGARPEGITDLAHHWANLAALADPPLQHGVFLTSRSEECEIVTAWLTGQATELGFESASPQDVIDFLAALVVSLPEPERLRVESRALIVEERSAWRRLAISPRPLILIAAPGLALEGELVAEAVRHGHHVLLASTRLVGSPQRAKGLLARPYRYDLEKALAESGHAREAARLARESGGSLSVLKRLLARFRGTRMPKWSQPLDVNTLGPFLLAGSWEAGRQADQESLSYLAGGRVYTDLEADARGLAAGEDPPLMLVLGRWTIISREDSWFLAASYLSRDQITRFCEVAVSVLSEQDPRYDLPPEDRWSASMQRVFPAHSSILKNGLAETLALMGTRGALIDQANGLNLEKVAAMVVRRLLDEEHDWRHWASLSDHLPLLAETAPEEFLTAVEADLSRPQPAVLGIFGQESGQPFPSSPHTELLWALEALCWAPKYLARASIILARLTRQDPGGRLSNRPGSSLHRVFVPWCPQTTGNASDRLHVIDQIITVEPEVAWDLLLSLTPKRNDMSFPGYEPRWRSWAQRRSEAVLMREYLDQVQGMTERLLHLAGEQTERWEQLFDKLEELPSTGFDAVLKWLEEGPPPSMDERERYRVWDNVRNKVTEHRFYHKADWAMPMEVVNRLAATLPLFVPADPALSHAWLFGNNVHLPEDTMDDNWETQQKRHGEVRIQVAEELFRSSGLPVILRLAENVSNPGLVGVALGKASASVRDEDILPSLLAEDAPKSQYLFARGFAAGKMDLQGMDWVERQPLADWPVSAVVDVLTLRPFSPETWNKARELGPAVWMKYWQEAAPLVFGLQTPEVEEAAREFLIHNRPFAAMDTLATARFEKIRPSWELILETLEAALGFLSDKGEERFEPKQHDWRHARELFKHLQERPEVDAVRLGKLEWAYLPLLDGFSGSPVALSRAINAEPVFFVQLLSLAFRAKSDGDDEKEAEAPEPTEREREMALNAFKLVHRLWRGLPGKNEDTGEIDSVELQAWVRQARELARGAARLGICDSVLGEKLAQSPLEDGRWPCRAICEVLEAADGDDLRSGFYVGIHNLRGTYSKSLGEGGQQERDLADTYRRRAEAWEVEFPRTAGVLRAVANSYEAEARQADEEIGRPPDHWRQLQQLRGEVRDFRVGETQPRLDG